MISGDELKNCIQTLERLLADRTLLSKVSTEERKALLMAAGKLSRPDRLEIMKLSKKHRRDRNRRKREMDIVSRSKTGIRQARTAKIFIPPPQLSAGEATSELELLEPRSCYVCKVDFQKLHHFYDTMCCACGDLNYMKRFQSADLHGQVALVTGSRVKIGYQAGLKLLRAGAEVIVTTRFPNDAALRYAREDDFAQWKNRLHIFGLDLRHAPSVELFANFLCATWKKLDILINNAAQTVRRPPGWYDHLSNNENLDLEHLPGEVRPVLAAYERCIGRMREVSITSGETEAPSGGWMTSWYNTGAAVGLSSPSAYAKIPWVSEDLGKPQELFPVGRMDADLQQVDLRNINSWRLALGDVPTPEMIEVQLVNSISPFILCSKLKPLMLKSETPQKHVINVSAMEGKFYRFTKTDKHPHTNMAKAALNMMTLTSAPDYAKDNIYMNAVDTGWVTDEDPIVLSTRKQEEHDFHPPLDIVDGAARVLDPVFSGNNGGELVYGKFLKDYTPTSW